jgi:quinol monooxygenase YgiN
MDDAELTLDALQDGFVVAINLEAKEGASEAVAKILQGLVAPSMAEPGMKLFLPYRSPKDPNLFFVFELYREEAGRAAHQDSLHFKEAIEELLPRVIRRELVPFVPYGAA